MTMPIQSDDRRSALRFRNDDVLRWKRPGRIEDHKGWAIDRSQTGLGFAVLRDEAPRVGERLHLRLFDRDRWKVIEGAVRVARVDPASDERLVMVGCCLQTSVTADGE
jgi:hypothetical protein